MTPNPNPSPELLSETEDLRPWGYAPGSYVFTCRDCPADLDIYDKMGRLGDKRSIRCEEHARVARDAMPAFSRLAFNVDAKVEYPAFASWWARTIPAEPVPNSASHHFAAWMASVRYRAALSPQTLPAPPLSTDVQSAVTGFHEQDVSLKVALPAPGEVERAAVVAYIRRQSDRGADIGNEKPKGSTARAAFGGGSLALKRVADNIEAGEHILNDNALPATVAAANDEGVARKAEHARIVEKAKQALRLTQGCMECNADDERRWMDTIRWLEEQA